jgi:tetratricopeptide (TPR) repeat protein
LKDAIEEAEKNGNAIELVRALLMQAECSIHGKVGKDGAITPFPGVPYEPFRDPEKDTWLDKQMARVEEHLRIIGNRREVVEMMNSLAIIKIQRTELEDAVKIISKAVEYAGSSIEPFALAALLGTQGVAFKELAIQSMYRPNPNKQRAEYWLRKAVESQEQSAKHANKSNNIALISAALINGSLALAMLGELDAAETDLRQAIKLKRQIGDRKGLVAGLENLSMIMGRKGNYAEANELREEAEAIRIRFGITGGKVWHQVA